MDYFLKSGKIEKTQGRKVCLLYGDDVRVKRVFRNSLTSYIVP